jgi:hypothetical protein
MSCKVCGRNATESTVERCRKSNCPYEKSTTLDEVVDSVLAVPAHTHRGVIDAPDESD